MKFLFKLWNVGYIVSLMALIRIGLSILPLSKLLLWLSSPTPPTAQDLDALKVKTYFTDRLLNRFPYHEHGNCLPRTCMLYWLACRCGFPVKFHCGVRRGEAGLVGHAWLTLNGHPFLEPTQQCLGMVETFSFPKE